MLLLARFDSKYSKLSTIHCCAPTSDTEEKEKENFYIEQQAITSTLPRHDVLIIMIDIYVYMQKLEQVTLVEKITWLEMA